MRPSIEQSWMAQRRQLAAGILTGIALISAVVVSRRVAGDASAFASQFWPTILGVVGIGSALFAVAVPGILTNVTALQRFVATALCGMPGLILGLSLMPTGSTAGLGSLLAFFALALWISYLAYIDAFPQVRLTIGRTSITEDVRDVTSHDEADRGNPAGPTSYDPSLDSIETGNDAGHVEFDSILSIEADLETRLAQLNSETLGNCDVDCEETSIPHPSQNPNTKQWFSRSVKGHAEQLEGVITTTLAVNEERAAIHIPFAPALDTVPEFECEAINGEPVEISVSQLKSYGARLELKRPKSDSQNALVVQVGYFASLEVAESELDQQRVSA